MDGKSQSISDEQKQKLAELFPEVFEEGKIDWDKLKATLGKDADLGERYGLSWKGKGNVFRAIQEHTTKTLKPTKDESVDWDTTQNIFIEGDNLEALKILHKSYYGKVKMIYIDPPYNTGNDFVYNDKFAQTRAEYESEAGIRDEEGNVIRTDGLRKNTKDSGHFHSDWLNMMYPRLYLARNLLRQDGVIFVSIDDNEVHNLRLVMNEIFGEENFVAQLIWEKKYTTSNNIKGISYTHDYILCFVRNSTQVLDAIGRYEYTAEARSRFKNPDNDPRGDWSDVSYHGPKSPTERPNLNYPLVHPKTNEEIWPREKSWAYEKSAYQKHVSENRLWWGKRGDYAEPRLKIFYSEIQGGLIPKSLLSYKDFGTTSMGRADFRELFGKNDEGALFDNPKPVRLIRKLCEVGSTKDGVILDFFSGSGTTAQAVLQLNADDGGDRKMISIQLPEETSVESEARLAGYDYISDIAKERIRRAGKKISADFADKLKDRKQPLDLGFKVFKVSDSNFKAWNADVENVETLRQQMFDNLQPLIEGATEESLLTELLVKNGIDLSESILKSDEHYFVRSVKLIICLEKIMTQELFTKILKAKPEKVIFLDLSLTGNDQLKANLLLQAEQAGVTVEVL